MSFAGNVNMIVNRASGQQLLSVLDIYRSVLKEGRKQMDDKLKQLEHDKYVAERKLTAAKHKEKRLQSELKRLTRSERTHRLCTRAGMLETFLKEPTTLTDDDVMELLTFVFHSEAVQKKLDLLIENRKETEQPNGS